MLRVHYHSPRDSEHESSEIGTDSVVAIAGEVVYIILGYAVVLLLAREAGPTALGIYSIALFAVKIGGICCSVGLKQASLRYIPLYAGLNQGQLVKGIILFSSLVSAMTGLAMGTAFFAILTVWTRSTANDSLLAVSLKVTALTLPLMALQEVWPTIFQGFKAIKYKVLIEKFLEPAVRLLALGLFFLFGLKLLGGVLAILAGVVVALGISLYFLRTLMVTIPQQGHPVFEPKTWLSYSTPLMLQSMIVFLQPGIPLLLLEYFQDSAQVGIFSAAARVAVLISLPVIGLNTVFAPRIAEVYAQSEAGKLGWLYTTMTARTIFLCLPLYLIIFAFAGPIMRIFGPGFEAGAASLILLALGQFVLAAAGSAGCILVMTGRVTVSLLNAFFSVFVVCLLNIVLTPQLGIMGAAIASTAAMAGMGLLSLVEVHYLLRLQPYTGASWKPLISGAIAGAGLLFLPLPEWVLFQALFFWLVYLCSSWFLSSADEKTRTRYIALALIRGSSRAMKIGYSRQHEKR